MFSDSYGNDIHEGRHGGQIARGEYDIDQDDHLIFGSFGASKEIDAYRAQFAADGKLSFEPWRDYTEFENLQEIGQKDLKVVNFKDINKSFLKRRR